MSKRLGFFARERGMMEGGWQVLRCGVRHSAAEPCDSPAVVVLPPEGVHLPPRVVRSLVPCLHAGGLGRGLGHAEERPEPPSG